MEAAAGGASDEAAGDGADPEDSGGSADKEGSGGADVEVGNVSADEEVTAAVGRTCNKVTGSAAAEDVALQLHWLPHALFLLLYPERRSSHAFCHRRKCIHLDGGDGLRGREQAGRKGKFLDPSGKEGDDEGELCHRIRVDETNTHCEFRPISNMLKTMLARFISMRRFSSLSLLIQSQSDHFC